jgi:hypothetical protein
MRGVRLAALLVTLSLVACDRPADPAGTRASSAAPATASSSAPIAKPAPSVAASSVPPISAKPPLPSDPAKAAAVLRCEAAMARAGESSSRAEALRLYHRACAELAGRTECRSAWQKAAEQDSARALTTLYGGCRGYCPALVDQHLELCKPGFKPSREALERAWAPFIRAVWRFELGPAASRVERAIDVGFNEGGERWPKER